MLSGVSHRRKEGETVLKDGQVREKLKNQENNTMKWPVLKERVNLETTLLSELEQTQPRAMRSPSDFPVDK